MSRERSQCRIRIALERRPAVLAVGATQEIEIASFVGLQNVVQEESAVTARVVRGRRFPLRKPRLDFRAGHTSPQPPPRHPQLNFTPTLKNPKSPPHRGF